MLKLKKKNTLKFEEHLNTIKKTEMMKNIQHNSISIENKSQHKSNKIKQTCNEQTRIKH